MRRRSFLAGLGGTAIMATQSRAFAQADPGEPIYGRLDDLQRRFDANIGVYGLNPANSQTLSFHDGDPFAMCSTFKVYAAARVLQRAERQEVLLTDPVPIDSADIVSNSPVTEGAVGSTLPLGELCRAALQQSDNTAGNLLLRNIGGPPAVTPEHRR